MSRILIVEDDEDIGAVLQRELKKEGYETVWASTGTEGRMMLGTGPDLILMDLMLPGMSGEELLKHIPKQTPVIAVSARSSTDDKISLLSEGCVDYITKPFDIRELKARVNAALRTTSRNGSSARLTC
ncbi:MAG: response regulator transcription factor, partial [Clostridiales bacterium]|nr:response regulator transcription factor [Clostridiales bacterium]